MILAQQAHTAMDISADAEILTYVHSGDPVTVIGRFDLWNISGTAEYELKTAVNGVVLVPRSVLTVRDGRSSLSAPSRQLVLTAGDILRVTVVGSPQDRAVDTGALLVDVTPVDKETAAGDISGAVTDAINAHMTGLEADLIARVLDALRQVTVGVVKERTILGSCTRAPATTPRAVPGAPVPVPTVVPQRESPGLRALPRPTVRVPGPVRRGR